MADQKHPSDVVLEAVRQGQRRLRRHALVVELSRGAVVAAVVPAVLAAVRVVRPVPSLVIVAAFVLPAVLLALWASARVGRYAVAERAARRMDADAALNDELVSAHWFAAHGPRTDWTRAQIDRAAARIAGVDW